VSAPVQRHGIDRRSLLGGAASLVAMPHVLRAAKPVDTDVVIVGAGAAGLAAARVLRARGIRFELVEIRTRVGGRAHTDTSYFGVPVDLGCAELHNASSNPWVGYAREHGIDIGPLPSANTLFDGLNEVSDEQAWEVAREAANRHETLRRACRSRLDLSVADALAASGEGPWDASIRLWLGPISSGIDLEEWSLLDWCAGRRGENWHAPAGFGSLIANAAGDIPVRLNTGVREITWSDRTVGVTTDSGTVTARATIVTLPVGVLKDGAVKFTPGLPVWKLRALEGMASAQYIRVLMKFREDLFGRPAGSWVAHRVDGPEGFSFWINPGGHGVTHAVAGGRFAVELELASADEAVDSALDVLRSMLGSRIDRAFEEGTATIWAQDPYARGAWAEVRAGHFGARQSLLRPLAGRVFFAGDAYHHRMSSTAGGAALVGEAVARDVADVVSGP
jgi:monoamine oxidase